MFGPSAPEAAELFERSSALAAAAHRRGAGKGGGLRFIDSGLTRSADTRRPSALRSSSEAYEVDATGRSYMLRWKLCTAAATRERRVGLLSLSPRKGAGVSSSDEESDSAAILRRRADAVSEWSDGMLVGLEDREDEAVAAGSCSAVDRGVESLVACRGAGDSTKSGCMRKVTGTHKSSLKDERDTESLDVSAF